MSAAYRDIGDYGVIGDCHSAALVSIDGSIDWCTFPRFDSPSVFAAILDAGKGGSFSIRPAEPFTAEQRYLPMTNVLETTFRADNAVLTLTDCMPLYPRRPGQLPVAQHEVVRHLRVSGGPLAVSVEYSPRPDYGRSPAELLNEGEAIVTPMTGGRLMLHPPGRMRVSEIDASATLNLVDGEEAVFRLSFEPEEWSQRRRDELPPQEQIERTIEFWKGKTASLGYAGPYRQMVERSYLTLHLLTHLPTGGIVAAATTSLPEEIGGERNWDYRYTWLRDAAFTVEALSRLGHIDEALTFLSWLARVCEDHGDDLQIMYRVDGRPNIPEEALYHLEGYRGSAPVRVGNGAHDQRGHPERLCPGGARGGDL